MLDLVFKRLKFVTDYLAHERAKLMAAKYDRKILLPMLGKYNQFLNLAPTYRMTIQFTLLCSSFMQGRLLISKLSIFCDCVLNVSDDIGSPWVWWAEHARLHPNVAILSKQIFAIPSS
jgi:hypothetical protein